MEKVREDTASFASFYSSPRSILGWKDDWGDESPGLESTNRSSAELPSVNPNAPKTPFQLERRLFRSHTPVNPNRQVYGSLPLAEPPSGTEGSTAVVGEQRWSDTPLTSTLGAFQLGPNEQGRPGQPSELLETTLHQDHQIEESPPAHFVRVISSGYLSSRDYENSVGTAGEDTYSVDSFGSTAATAPHGKKTLSSNRMQYMTSLSDELNSIKSGVKRAIDFGKKVQHYGALEVSQLQGEKANAEASVRKSVESNCVLEQQVSTLREELQKLQLDRELEILTMSNEIQELEMKKNTLMKAAQDEKRKREQLQSEIDSVLSVILGEKMQLEIEREAHDTALQNERKKLQAMKKARDDAVKALQDGTKKLEVERDAMFMAMRDLTSRLDFERDAKLKSMRRTSMDMATMMSTFRLGGSKNKSSGTSEDAPISRPLSRRNSRQF